LQTAISANTSGRPRKLTSGGSREPIKKLSATMQQINIVCAPVF
jgi:hypothetical protein